MMVELIAALFFLATLPLSSFRCIVKRSKSGVAKYGAGFKNMRCLEAAQAALA